MCVCAAETDFREGGVIDVREGGGIGVREGGVIDVREGGGIDVREGGGIDVREGGCILAKGGLLWTRQRTTHLCSPNVCRSSSPHSEQA